MQLKDLLDDNSLFPSGANSIKELQKLLALYIDAFKTPLDVFSIIKDNDALPKGFSACIKRASSLLSEKTDTLSFLGQFCQACAEFYSCIPAQLLPAYTLLTLQSLVKVLKSITERQLVASLLSVPSSARTSLCQSVPCLVNLVQSIPFLLTLIDSVICFSITALYNESYRGDGCVVNYLYCIHFVATQGATLALISADAVTTNDDVGVDQFSTKPKTKSKALSTVKQTIPSSILQILTCRTSFLQGRTKGADLPPTYSKLIVGIKDYIVKLCILGASAQAQQSDHNSVHTTETDSDNGENSNEEDSSGTANTRQKLLVVAENMENLSSDDRLFMQQLADTGLDSLNHALALFTINSFHADVLSAVHKAVAGSTKTSFLTSPTGKHISAVMSLLVEKLFTPTVRTCTPAPTLLSYLTDVYFSSNNQGVSARILHIFKAVRESGPMGRTYVVDVLYPKWFQFRISTTTLHRRQSIYLLQNVFPVSDDMEVLTLDLKFMTESLVDSASTVREAAITCAVTVISLYYDCMPFAARSQLLSKLLESTFDVSFNVRSIAIDGVAELYKVASVRAAISDFVHSNKERLSLLILDGMELDEQTNKGYRGRKDHRGGCRNGYLKLICEIVHYENAVGHSKIDDRPSYKDLTSSTRLFYCSIYLRLLDGRASVLRDIFPDGIETLLGKGRDGGNGGNDGQGPADNDNNAGVNRLGAQTNALWNFMSNIVASMGSVSCMLLSTVVKYFEDDIELLRSPEARLLGYAVLLRTVLLLADYLFGSLKAFLSSEAVANMVAHRLEANFDCNEYGRYSSQEEATAQYELMYSLRTLLHIVPSMYSCLMVERDNVLDTRSRTLKQKERESFIDEVLSELYSACSEDLCALLRELVLGVVQRSSVLDNYALDGIILGYGLVPLVTHLAIDGRWNGVHRGNLSYTSNDLLQHVVHSSKHLTMPDTIDTVLDMLCMAPKFEPLSMEGIEQLCKTYQDVDKKETDRAESCTIAQGTECIIRYYHPSTKLSLAQDLVEPTATLLALTASVHNMKVDQEQQQGDEAYMHAAVTAFCALGKHILFSLYTLSMTRGTGEKVDVNLKENGKVHAIETNVLDTMLMCINYMLRETTEMDEKTDFALKLWNKVSSFGLDAINVCIHLSNCAAFNPMACMLMLQLHEHCQASRLCADSLHSLAERILAENGTESMFAAETLGTSADAVVPRLLRQFVAGMLAQAKEQSLCGKVNILSVINGKLSGSFYTPEGMDSYISSFQFITGFGRFSSINIKK